MHREVGREGPWVTAPVPRAGWPRSRQALVHTASEALGTSENTSAMGCLEPCLVQMPQFFPGNQKSLQSWIRCAGRVDQLCKPERKFRRARVFGAFSTAVSSELGKYHIAGIQ